MKLTGLIVAFLGLWALVGTKHEEEAWISIGLVIFGAWLMFS